MVNQWLLVIAVFLLPTVLLAESPTQREVTQQVLYRKALSTKQELLVTRTYIPNWQALFPLVDSTKANACFSIQVLLRNPEPVVVASRVQWESERYNTGFEVLDAVAAPGRIILAAGVGTRLAFWDIRFSDISQESWIETRDWPVAQLARPVTLKTVGARFEPMADGRWAVEVTDLAAHGAATPTRYEQDGMGWRVTRPWKLKESGSVPNSD